MSNVKIKKPFYKKWWVWLIAIVVVVAISSGGRNDNNVSGGNDTSIPASSGASIADSPPSSESKEDEKTEPAEKVESEKEKETEKAIKAGTYKVGSDIPAGEYLVFSKGMAYIESAKDSTGTLDSIIFNDNLMNNSHSYVTLSEGQYFKMTGAEMYPVDSAPSVVPKDGVYKAGMYKVGQDIPAGEYKVILDSAIGLGYMEVSSNSTHTLTSIITNDAIQADAYITVSDGQYLKLIDAYIEK